MAFGSVKDFSICLCNIFHNSLVHADVGIPSDYALNQAAVSRIPFQHQIQPRNPVQCLHKQKIAHLHPQLFNQCPSQEIFLNLRESATKEVQEAHLNILSCIEDLDYESLPSEMPPLIHSRR